VSQPTPGPWRYDGSAHVLGDDTGDRRVVATLNGPHEADETQCERCANGRLVAAAPELLAACEFSLSVHETQCLYDLSERMAAEKLRAGIAKARGEVPSC
jgi:hypothetical protein